MVENMDEFIGRVRRLVSDRLDFLKEASDDEIRETISQVVLELSREQFLTLNEKKTVLEGVFNSMRGLDVESVISEKCVVWFK